MSIDENLVPEPMWGVTSVLGALEVVARCTG